MMYISHSVMEGQRHNNPLNPRCFCSQRPKRDGSIAPNHIIVEVAKALGGSFKLVTLAPRTVREMAQLPKETRKNGDTYKSKRTIKHAKHKPRLNMYKKTYSSQPGCMNFLVLVAVHMENGKLPMYSVNARDHTSTALPSFSHDQHHETDAAKWKGGRYRED